MLTIIFAVAFVVSALGWLCEHVCALALGMCLVENGIFPDDEKLKDNLRYAWRKVLGIS